MKQATALRVGMMNVRGLVRTAQEIEDWILDDRINVLALSEILLTPGIHPNLSLQNETVSGPLNAHGLATKGGVAIVLYGIAKYKVVLRLREEYGQAVGVQIKGVTYVSVYISPAARRGEIIQFLNQIHRICRGTTIVLGDFNARQEDWCTENNTAGKALVDWCEDYEWRIDAPPFPTRQDTRCSTTVDLAITRNCKLTKFREATNYCHGISDHNPIFGEMETERARGENEAPRITLNRRTRPEYNEQTAERMEKELPDLLEKLSTVDSQELMDRLYKEYTKIMTTAYIPKGKKRNRQRYKYFWNDELNAKGRERSRLYRRWKCTLLPEHHDEYKAYAKELKKEIKKAKLASFKSFLAVLEDNITYNAAARISRSYKLRKKRVVRSTMPTEGELDLASFTKHVATKFPLSPIIAPRLFSFDKESFHKDVLQAIAHSARKKAAGSDAVFNEAIKLNPGLSADFLTQLWTRCGEIAKTPTYWHEILLVPIYMKGERHLKKNHRPIALMSHPRKIIEKAIDFR